MSKLKYYNGTTWKTVNGQITGDTLPIGAIVPFGGWDAPTGWLICDGTLLNKTAYPELFNAIGYSFGGEEGGATFGLPDLRGRVPVGLKETDTDFNGMGLTGGEKKHTLTIDEMPSHTHAPNSRATTFSGTGSNNPGQTGGDRTWENLAIGNTGGGQAHNNLQPYQTVNYIIKAKQSAGLVANVSNIQSESTTDTYSCNYINGIIDSGSNTNGYYIKYADGTMICYGSKSGTTTWSDWWSFAKRTPDGTSALSCTFPQNFIDGNVNVSITTGYGSTTFSASYNSISTTSFSFVCYKPTNDSSTNYAIKYIAIGRWK